MGMPEAVQHPGAAAAAAPLYHGSPRSGNAIHQGLRAERTESLLPAARLPFTLPLQAKLLCRGQASRYFMEGRSAEKLVDESYKYELAEWDGLQTVS